MSVNWADVAAEAQHCETECRDLRKQLEQETARLDYILSENKKVNPEAQRLHFYLHETRRGIDDALRAQGGAGK